MTTSSTYLHLVKPGASDLVDPVGQISDAYDLIDASFSQRGFNVKDKKYGAIGGTLTSASASAQNAAAIIDTAAIQAAIADATARAAGFPSGARVLLPPGCFFINAPLQLPSGVLLVGASTEATFLCASPNFSGSAMVTNLHTDGTQQDCYIVDMTVFGNAVGGATCGDCILLDSIFVNTGTQNVKTRYASGNGLHVQTTADVIFGPALFANHGSDHNGLDQVLIEGHFHNIGLPDLDVEHFASGKHGLHLKGTGHDASGVYVPNFYAENNQTNAASIWVENVSNVRIKVAEDRGGTQSSGSCMLRITGTNQWTTNAQVGSKGITIEGIDTLNNSGYVLVDDQTRSISITAPTSPATLERYDTEVVNFAGGVSAVGGAQPANRAKFDRGSTASLWVGADADSSTLVGGAAFGLSQDTTLYRAGTNFLRTNAALKADLGVIAQSAALNTTATSGFLYIPTCAGTPTGVPVTQAGTVAMVYDTTNHKLYIYDGAWKGGTAPGVFS